MPYDFLKELITLTEQYEAEVDGKVKPTAKDFAVWLFNKTKSDPSADLRMGNEPYEQVDNGNKIETEISILIVNMYRYARVYSKKALENTPLQTVDEFGYLATLLTYNCLKKTELIAKNIHEKPTGMEIIKRLLQNGLIDQFDDEQDKRSKLVKLNDKGKGLLYSIFGKMGKVSEIVTGDLETDEKIQLLYFLKKLDRFHHHIFTNEKEEVLESLA
ncbi:MAG TPA: hypothetical protein VK167_07480 [Flavipsychrobacter sp.]|jgi:DNA-binding MarR family transcriptional regulator|nr:hypothetical protein [Flavipsychrobacter sp.]